MFGWRNREETSARGCRDLLEPLLEDLDHKQVTNMNLLEGSLRTMSPWRHFGRK